MSQGTYVNPGQTLTVEYQTKSLDGTTPGKPIILNENVDEFNQDIAVPPNDEGIYVVKQEALGLIDPDFVDGGGARGDRFIPWFQVSSSTTGKVTIQLVDGADPTRVLRDVNTEADVDTTFYRDLTFRVPQGALIRVVGTDLSDVVVRLRAALDHDGVCEGSSGSGTCAENASARLAVRERTFDPIPRNSSWPLTDTTLVMPLDTVELASESEDPNTGENWVTLDTTSFPEAVAKVIPGVRYWYKFMWLYSVTVPGLDDDPLIGLYGYKGDGSRIVLDRTMLNRDESPTDVDFDNIGISGLIEIPEDVVGIVPFIVDVGLGAGSNMIVQYNNFAAVGPMGLHAIGCSLDLVAVPGAPICPSTP
jgi:hypothetical protein